MYGNVNYTLARFHGVFLPTTSSSPMKFSGGLVTKSVSTTTGQITVSITPSDEGVVLTIPVIKGSKKQPGFYNDAVVSSSVRQLILTCTIDILELFHPDGGRVSGRAMSKGTPSKEGSVDNIMELEFICLDPSFADQIIKSPV